MRCSDSCHPTWRSMVFWFFIVPKRIIGCSLQNSLGCSTDKWSQPIAECMTNKGLVDWQSATLSRKKWNSMKEYVGVLRRRFWSHLMFSSVSLVCSATICISLKVCFDISQYAISQIDRTRSRLCPKICAGHWMNDNFKSCASLHLKWSMWSVKCIVSVAAFTVAAFAQMVQNGVEQQDIKCQTP